MHYLFSIVRHIKYNIYEVSDFKNTILDDKFCLFQHRRELLNQVWPSLNTSHIQLFRMLTFFSTEKSDQAAGLCQENLLYY